MDWVFSSGYLAFARHVGVVRALKRRGLSPSALVGTSSGGIVAALLAAGHGVERIAAALRERPFALGLRPHLCPWQGLLSCGPLARQLQSLLPERFEQLEHPLAVGVADEFGRHRLLHEGPLLPALLATFALPRVFPAVQVGALRYVDGGTVDRLGLPAWQRWRPEQRALAIVVTRRRSAAGASTELADLVVSVPRSKARLWSHGDFDGEAQQAQGLAEQQLENQLPEDPG